MENKRDTTTIRFITSNKGKVMSLQNRLPKGFVVKQGKLDIPEIQHSDIKEIARYKAKFAYEKIGGPLIVQDSAFHIEALSGFPGPYIKYINRTIGAQGVIKLMKGVKNRQAGFEMALAYVDKNGEISIFTNNVAERGGKIALEVAQEDSDKSWSEIWKIYIPKWSKGKTLSQLSKKEINKHEESKNDHSEFARFAAWLKKDKK